MQIHVKVKNANFTPKMQGFMKLMNVIEKCPNHGESLRLTNRIQQS